MLPQSRGAITIAEVLAAAPGKARDSKIAAWCLSVWEAYKSSHATVAHLLAERLAV